MKAVGFYQTGGPEVLEIVELNDPRPAPGEVRIRVTAAAVNPTDTGPRSGGRPEALRDLEPPYVPGMDAAGVLEEIGEGVMTDLKIGDHVMAIVVPRGSHGAYSEQICVPLASVVRTPAGASDVEASTLPMNGLTARLAIDQLELEPRAVVGVTGAAGAVGGYAIQLAKADGFVVIADAAKADTDLVVGFGADVIVERGHDVANRMRAAFPDGLDGLVDAALLNELCLPALRDGGRISTLRGYSSESVRGITYHPVAVRSVALEHDMLDRLREQVESGALTLRVAGTYPADRAADAQARLEAGGTRGRLVIEF